MKIKIVIYLVIIILLLTSCSPQKGNISTANDYSKYSSPINENATIMETISGDMLSYKANDKIQNAVAEMERLIKNGYLELYKGKKYSDIAVKDLRTGRVWLSNPALYINDDKIEKSDEAKKQAYSQLIVDYFKDNNKNTMYSYPDAIDGELTNQVSVKKIDEATVRFTYTLGKREDMQVVFTAMTENTYNEISKKIEELVSKNILDILESSLFENSYRKLSYKKLDNAQKATYDKLYPQFKKLGVIYEIRPSVETIQKSNIEGALIKSGFALNDINAEYKKLGYKAEGGTAPYFTIPLEYKLSGGDLLASIKTSEIEYGTNYKLNKVFLLGQFGATYDKTEGYMLLPNGSGSIVENGQGAYNMNTVDLPFYGNDYGLDIDKNKNVVPPVYFPVYGLKDRNSSLFAIVESGDANGGIVASVSNSFSSFNRVFPYFNYNVQDKVYLDGRMKLNELIVFAKKTTSQDFRVRYHFLYGDNSDYSGMATYFRNYLEKLGTIKKQEKKVVPFYLDFLGVVDKKKLVLGIPSDVKQELTTFQNAFDIISKYSNSGMKSFKVRFSGMFNGGLKYWLNSSLTIQSELTEKMNFKELEDKSDTIGVKIYPNVDMQFALSSKTKSNFVEKRDACVFLNKSPAIASPYDPVDLNRAKYQNALIINPLSYNWVSGDMLKSYNKVSKNNISLAKMGSVLGGNYDEDNPVTREEAKYLVVDTLKKISSSGRSIMTEGVNIYALPYLNDAINLELTSTNYRIESEAIPFIQMVLHGYVSYAGKPLNLSDNYDYEYLKSVETGAGLYYQFMYGNNILLKNTEFENYFSADYRNWINKSIELYKRQNEELKDTVISPIIKHRKLTDNVYETSYENGTNVIVNYNDKEITANGLTIKAKDYAVIKR